MVVPLIVGQPGVGKTRMAREVGRALEQKNQGKWVFVNALVEEITKADAYDADKCLARALVYALWDSTCGIPESELAFSLAEVLQKVKADLQVEWIILNLDEYQSNVDFSAKVLTSCGRLYRKGLAAYGVCVAPMASGVPSTNITTYLKGTSFATKQHPIAPVVGDGGLDQSFASFLGIGFDMFARCDNIRVMVQECGGFPAFVYILASLLLDESRLSMLTGIKAGALGSGDAAKLWTALFKDLDPQYGKERWINYLRAFEPGCTKQMVAELMRTILAHALAGAQITSDSRPVINNWPTLTFERAQELGIFALSSTTKQIQMSLVVASILNKAFAVALDAALPNPFEMDDRVLEVLALESLHVRLLSHGNLGFESIGVANLRPMALSRPGPVSALSLVVPQTPVVMVDLANHIDKDKLPLATGLDGKGPVLTCLEPGSLYLTAKDRKAMDGVAVFDGKLGSKKVTVIWLSQSKWQRVHEPSTGSKSKSKVTDGSVRAVVEDLRAMGRFVEGRLKTPHASVVFVYDLFTTRTEGSHLGTDAAKEFGLKSGEGILLVTTADTVSSALGPLFGVRSGIKRLLEKDAEMPASKKQR
jgi:hypothetical protein